MSFKAGFRVLALAFAAVSGSASLAHAEAKLPRPGVMAPLNKGVKPAVDPAAGRKIENIKMPGIYNPNIQLTLQALNSQLYKMNPNANYENLLHEIRRRVARDNGGDTYRVACRMVQYGEILKKDPNFGQAVQILEKQRGFPEAKRHLNEAFGYALFVKEDLGPKMQAAGIQPAGC